MVHALEDEELRGSFDLYAVFDLREAILGGNTMLVEVPWLGVLGKKVICPFSLAGSRAAYERQCGAG